MEEDEMSFSFCAEGKYLDSSSLNNYLNNSMNDSVNNSINSSINSSINDSFNNSINVMVKSPSMEDVVDCMSPPDPINYLTKRTREKWVEDSAVTKCKSCNSTFRIYRRRHHCKNCGNVYCDSCSKYRSKIPKVIKKIPSRTGGEEKINYDTSVRLCFNCYTNFETIHKLEKLLTVFSLLDLDLFDFRNLSMVCKAWRPMALFYLSKFREIQYKLPKYSYNSWEKQALWTNRYLLKNHSIWEIHVLRSLRMPPKDIEKCSLVEAKRIENKRDRERTQNKKKFKEAITLYCNNTSCEEKNMKECWDRMCSRYCRTQLDVERALLLLDILEKDDDILANAIVNTFDICSDYTLECYLPYILFKMVSNDNMVIKEWIYGRCIRSVRISSVSYWFLKNQSKLHFAELCENLPQSVFSMMIKSEKFLETLKENRDLDGKIISCVNPELGEQVVNKDGISVKKSATRPTYIPCDKSSVLFKKDDIRRDQIIIYVIRLMEKILKDAGMNISLVTYNVQPTSKDEGFIQIVENCKTLYEITEKMNTNIINYLLKNNPHDSVYNLRNRFMTSCAVYSVIAFLLSISDRNTENLMLTNTGDFFGIDFSFILGTDPKILRTSCIRITPEMLEALGGEKSQEYEEFKELCGQVYDILRRHVNTFVCLLSLIPTFKSNTKTCPDIDEKQMYSEIIKRFCPGETYQDAIRNLKTRIDDSADHSTLNKYHVIDFFHKHNREATVSTFLENGLSVAYKGTKSLMGNMYSYWYS